MTTRFPASMTSLVALLTISTATVTAEQPATVAFFTLQTALREALRNSPRLESAQDLVIAARIQHTAAAARYSPKVVPSLNTRTAAGDTQRNIGVSLSQLLPTGAELHASTFALPGIPGVAFGDRAFAFSISQPLLNGFGAADRAELRTGTRAVESAVRGVDDARQQLVIGVAQAYFAVLRQQRLVAECKRVLTRAATLADMAEARARVGLSTQLDVFRARMFQSQAQVSAIGAADQLTSAVEELNALLGRAAALPLEVSDDAAGDLEAIERALDSRAADTASTSEAFIRAAVARRSDVIDARERLTDAHQRAAAARWSLLPQINLDASYMRQAPQLVQGVSDYSSGWRVGLSAGYSLDRATGSAAFALAEIAVHSAERVLADREEHASTEIRKSMRAVSRADEMRTLQLKALELARQQRDLAALRYERGLADNLEVVDSENGVFQAETGLISSDLDRAMSVLFLQQALGLLEPARFLK